MRKKVSLYIGGKAVDLDDQSFILFNYTVSDLTNPTIVKNSYTQQITLKGTPNNNAIFGDVFRLDRRIAYNGSMTGVDFNPSVKTPFTIYNEMNEVVESGYVKLDSVNRKKNVIEYKVTLYGGLGSFLYSLSYDAEGNKRTLADLDYLGTGNSASELNFLINASAVREAWDTDNEGEIDNIWKVINFAPAYNGIPDGNFDAKKALVVPSKVGLSNFVISDGKTYMPKNGYALVNLAQSQDEWSVKDLRSYLQRPVFSMRAFWKAIANPQNNGGYSVDASVLDDYQKFPFGNLWLTLPMIPSIGTEKQESGNLDLTLSSSATTNKAIGKYTIDGSVPFGTKVSATLNVKFQSITARGASTLYRKVGKSVGRNYYTKESAIFLQAVAYSADGTMVGGSKVKTICSGLGRVGGKDIAEKCGYTPEWTEMESLYEMTDNSYIFDKGDDGKTYTLRGNIGFAVDAVDVAYYVIYASTYRINTDGSSITNTWGGDSSVPTLFGSYDNEVIMASSLITNGDVTDSITYTSAETLRSDAAITKKMLLSTSHTPADYLLSFCKMFGLYLSYNSSTKAITILRRNDLYKDEVIDISKRVDRSKDINITPFAFTSKWYEFSLEGVGGAFYNEYLETQGKEYGLQRVNTGNDFNAETTNLMESVVFKNACTILGKSKYFNTIKQSGNFVPSVFLDKGNTYTLWDTEGNALDTEIPCPSYKASVAYFNEQGYDYDEARKLELCDADKKPISGEDILLFWEGTNYYDYFRLSDDLTAMDLLNDGVPCWILDPGEEEGIAVPIFQRYTYRHSWNVDESLDFGLPSELDIPNITYDESKTIYSRGWKKYLADRYDVNTKVMTCKVNLSGLQVGTDLLRKFFWYENSLWVLNSIKNYSLTTYDPAECEFVQVQNKDNYLNGQKYNGRGNYHYTQGRHRRGYQVGQ